MSLLTWLLIVVSFFCCARLINRGDAPPSGSNASQTAADVSGATASAGVPDVSGATASAGVPDVSGAEGEGKVVETPCRMCRQTGKCTLCKGEGLQPGRSKDFPSVCSICGGSGACRLCNGMGTTTYVD